MSERLKGLQKERTALNRDIYMLSCTEEGKKLMKFLDAFRGRLLSKTKDGAVDPFKMAYTAGQHDLIKQIKDMINDGQLAR